MFHPLPRLAFLSILAKTVPIVTLVTGAKSINSVMPKEVITDVPLGVPVRNNQNHHQLRMIILPVLPIPLVPNVLYLPISAIGVNMTMPVMPLEVNMVVLPVSIVIRMIGVVGVNPSPWLVPWLLHE
jgi:hypothetical protein